MIPAGLRTREIPLTTIPFQTRAAWLGLDGPSPKETLARRIDELVSAGYDTVVVPLLSRGELLAEPATRKKHRGELSGRAGTALRLATERGDCAVWLAVDPLTAGLPDGTLGGLARHHREWLMRNTAGRRSPMGRTGHGPLFSWMNMEWRRFLGEALVRIVCQMPLSGIVVDLRPWPGRSDDEAGWYCCSFDSQVRAEQALGLNFEFLLAEGSRHQIEAWQSWVRAEMRAFIESLMGRTRVFRSDIRWRLLLPPTDPREHEQSPWVDWIADGLVSEIVLSDGGEEWPFARQAEAIESRSVTRLLFHTAGTPETTDAEPWPFAGRFDLEPVAPGDADPRPVPAADAFEQAMQLAASIEERMEEKSRGRRYVRHARRTVERMTITPESCEALHRRVRELEDDVSNGRFGFQDSHAKLIPDARLCLRLLGSVMPPPPVY